VWIRDCWTQHMSDVSIISSNCNFASSTANPTRNNFFYREDQIRPKALVRLVFWSLNQLLHFEYRRMSFYCISPSKRFRRQSRLSIVFVSFKCSFVRNRFIWITINKMRNVVFFSGTYRDWISNGGSSQRCREGRDAHSTTSADELKS